MILVIGAGIAGLSLGYELACRGAKVTVLEAGKIANGASGMATSYLEPRLGTTSMRKIEWDALSKWENYAKNLHQTSGINVGFQSEGQIRVSLDEYLTRFEKDLQERAAQNWKYTPLNPTQLRHLAPDLSNKIVAAAHLPDVCWVNGKSVCDALAIAIRNAGGMVIENSPVVKISVSKKTVSLSLADEKTVHGNKLVLCNGVGANDLVGLPNDIPKSQNIRGVNLLADMVGLKQPIRHLIKHHRGYLCPRELPGAPEGLIVGTTYEEGENSLKPKPHVVEQLYKYAESILPEVRRLPLLGVSAGLRTKVGDGMLRLGRSHEASNIYYSLSHVGAGFLRAPTIAGEFAGFVLDGQKGKLTGEMTGG